MKGISNEKEIDYRPDCGCRTADPDLGGEYIGQQLRFYEFHQKPAWRMMI
jgi:hypothetical protein